MMIKKIEYIIYFRPQLLITDFIPSFLINIYSKWNGAFENLAASNSFLTAQPCLDKSTVGAKTNKLKESDKVIGAVATEIGRKNETNYHLQYSFNSLGTSKIQVPIRELFNIVNSLRKHRKKQDLRCPKQFVKVAKMNSVSFILPFPVCLRSFTYKYGTQFLFQDCKHVFFFFLTRQLF